METIFDRACSRLPLGWRILIKLQDDGADVCLENPDGDDIDLCSDGKSTEQQIDAAISYAREHDKDFQE